MTISELWTMAGFRGAIWEGVPLVYKETDEFFVNVSLADADACKSPAELLDLLLKEAFAAGQITGQEQEGEENDR